MSLKHIRVCKELQNTELRKHTSDKETGQEQKQKHMETI